MCLNDENEGDTAWDERSMIYQKLHKLTDDAGKGHDACEDRGVNDM